MAKINNIIIIQNVVFIKKLVHSIFIAVVY